MSIAPQIIPGLILSGQSDQAPVRTRSLRGLRISFVGDPVPEVLFVCVHNAGRSQMAAGMLKRKAAGRVRVISAGSEPADQLNSAVVAAMSEIGSGISADRPKKVADGMVRESDVVMTMGCGDACPIYPGKRYEDWELEDPAGKDLETVRGIRDEIEARVERLVGELTTPRA